MSNIQRTCVPLRTMKAWFGLLLFILLVGCKQSNHGHSHGGHDHGGHGHGGGHSHGGHGHDHGHGHGEEGETVSVTLYTKHTELFMEYPRLVAGKDVAFLAHFTQLGKTFKAVKKGYLKLTFIQNGTPKHRLLARSVLRKGIFKPQGKAPPAGRYKLVVSLTSPQVLDAHVLPVVVYASKKLAKEAKVKEAEEGDVSFLKEQQWNIPFVNQSVSRRTIRDSVEVVGSVQPKAGQFARLTAPVSGVVQWLSPVLQEGSTLKARQLLLRITPQLLAGADLPQLQQAIANAQSNYLRATWERKRLSRMAKKQAVASWQLQKATVREKQWKSQWEAAKKRLQLFRRSRRMQASRGHTIQLRAPLRGTVTQLNVTAGMFVEQGKPLLTLVDRKKLELIANLPEGKLALQSKITDASVWTSKTWRGLGRPLRKGLQLDSTTRTLPLFFGLPKGTFWVDQHVKVQLHLQSRSVLAIPRSALQDDKGKPVVFVQKTGESFTKQRVTLGAYDRGWVEVKNGLKEGDRVVTTGAYEIMVNQALKQGGAVGHGHAH